MIRKLLFYWMFFCCISINLSAQTNLYLENFEGNTHSFSLNTADQSSTTSGDNTWLVNNSYTGGTISICGLSSSTIASTPAQPTGVTNNPASKYMHICSTVGAGVGVNNCHFVASDGGLICVVDQNHFSKMDTGVTTIGYDSIEVSFYYICGGSTANYGEMYYSVDGGNSWLLVQGNLQGQSSWTQQKVTFGAFTNHANFRVGFRFVNNFTLSATDPAFGVDEIRIDGFNTNAISSPSFTGTSFCAGDNIAINFTASGAFNASNVFSAELSDANGSFANPVIIGSVASTGSGLINATIPTATPAGAAYRIRIRSDNPAAIGPTNGQNISIAAGPQAGTINAPNTVICAGTTSTLVLSGYSGSILDWESSVDNLNFNSLGQSADSIISNPVNQTTYFRAIVQNSCGNDSTAVFILNTNPSPVASFNYSQTLGGLGVSFVNNTSGSYSTVQWAYGDGNFTNNDNPSYTYSAPGEYEVVLTVINSFGCQSVYIDTIEVFPVSVNHIEAINELQLFPNPVASSTSLLLDLSSSLQAKISLYDLVGREMEVVFNGLLLPGKQQVSVNMENLPSGTYFLVIASDKGNERIKINKRE